MARNARLRVRRLPLAEDDLVLLRLEDAVAAAGSAKAWSDSVGISQAYVSDVRLGRTDPGPSILTALGMERRVSYVLVRP